MLPHLLCNRTPTRLALVIVRRLTLANPGPPSSHAANPNMHMSATAVLIPGVAMTFATRLILELTSELLLLAKSRIGGSLLISVLASFSISHRTAGVSCRVVSQPVWPACWIDTPDRSSSSVSCAVQDAWDIYREELGVVPPDVVLALKDAFSRSDVHDFWTIWSKGAEAGLFSAYCECEAGGPTAAGSSAFVGRGLLRIRSGRLGGRAVGGKGASRL